MLLTKGQTKAMDFLNIVKYTLAQIATSSPWVKEFFTQKRKFKKATNTKTLTATDYLLTGCTTHSGKSVSLEDSMVERFSSQLSGYLYILSHGDHVYILLHGDRVYVLSLGLFSLVNLDRYP